MKKLFFSFLIISSSLVLPSCNRSSGDIWEDTKTLGRHIHRKGRLLWNHDVDSRMISSSDEFKGPQEEEFIPLCEKDIKTQYSDYTIAQSKDTPGASGSAIPGIEAFHSPAGYQSKVFKNLYFNTDEHIFKGKEYFQIISNIVEFMKKNPNCYIFVAGHCDERASEAYNLALGTRRANYVRSLLVKEGINSNQIFTISYGKEMPVDLGHSPEAWAKNRRVEFKIFEKNSKRGSQ